MSNPLLQAVEKAYMKSDLPLLLPGDTVRVMVRIREGNKERLQAFEGIIIRIRGEGVNRTFPFVKCSKVLA